MKRPLAMFLLAACASAAVVAQSTRSYPCTNGNQTRRIEVAYEGATDVPCEVRYHKEGEEPQVLWRAGVEPGYCEARARDFLVKLQGLGWTCTDAGSAPATTSPRSSADDTAALGAEP